MLDSKPKSETDIFTHKGDKYQIDLTQQRTDRNFNDIFSLILLILFTLTVMLKL